MKRVQRVRQTYKRPRRHFVASLIRKMEYFVNMENGRDLPRPSRRFAIVAGLLIGSWLVLALPIPGMAFVVVGLIIASVVLAIGWRKKFPLIVLLLNPAFFSFSSGICEWLHERPRLWYTGLPGDEFFNLDPISRCYRMSGGCLVNGNEWITDSPHNGGLWVMLGIFGRPPRTYHGPYPTKVEATQLTEAASETPSQLFLRGKVLVDGRQIALGKDEVQVLLRDLGAIFDVDSGDSKPRVRALILKNGCLIVRVDSIESLDGTSPVNEFDGIVLFDAVNLRPFARYVLKGHPWRIPAMLLHNSSDG